MNTKTKMSSLVDSTTYTGKDALGFYSKALLGGDFVTTIKINADIKSKEKFARLDLANILQQADCTFTAGGTATLSQKTLEVCPVKVNLELCVRDFEVNYLSEQLKPGSNSAQVPASLQDYLMEQISKTIADCVDNIAINGNTATSPAGSLLDLCQGLLIQFDNDAAVIDVTGTTLSAANIIAEIGKLYAAIPNTISSDVSALRIYMSPTAAKFYRQALAAVNNALVGSYNNGDFKLSYIDIQIQEVKHLPTNVMFAARWDNLWFGTDLMSDLEDVKIIDMYESTGSPNIRFVASFKIGFGYAVGEEIAYYH